MNIVFIDDDKNIRNLYRKIVETHFPDITEIYEAGTVKDGIELLRNVKADLLVLDIDLSDGNGFDVLQAVKPYSFSLIFSTAFNEFAIKAIKFSALDYILKPLDSDEFCAAIDKSIAIIEKSNLETQLMNFFEHYEKKNDSKKLVLKTSGELHIVDINDIIFCNSDNSYTTFSFKDSDDIIVSRSMKEFEDILSDYNFFRPHMSYLVNLNYIQKLDKSDGGFLILKNGKKIPVSQRKKARLIKILEEL
ncbi:MAG: LytTR family DNA-binding domain-containing protein [Bacteroidales bacterium]|nr:LytTR family DNA-binding domain-containing protein [Bacteroidales bacterium]